MFKNVIGVTAFLTVFIPSNLFAFSYVEEWVNWYDVSCWDQPSELAVDSSGNVYVTGWINTECGLLGGSSEYVTLKYDTNGNKLWVKRYESGYPLEYATAIAVDLSGNVYVTGYSHTDKNAMINTIKYDTNGNELWIKRYGNAAYNFVYDMAIDTSGNIYLAGSSSSGLSGDDNFILIKYNTNGNTLWIREYDSGAHDRATHLTIDLYGNVYVTGNRDSYYITIKYDAEGNTLWINKYSSRSFYSTIAVDYSGNAYVAGYAYSASGLGVVTVKYDTNGIKLWDRIYESGTVYPNKVDVAVDSSGGVYVLAFIVGERVLIKYDTDGNRLYIKQNVSSGNLGDITSDSLNNIYVTSSSGTIAFDSSGNEMWRKESCISNIDIVTDSLQNVYVTGSNGNIATRKYSKPPSWSPSAPSNPMATAISPSRITLTWSDNSDNEDGFKIMRSTKVEGEYTLIAILPANIDRYEDTELNEDAAYFYRIKAFNAAGDSDYANGGGCYDMSATTLKMYNACNVAEVVRSIRIGNEGIEIALVSLAENACRQIGDGKIVAGKNMLEALIKEVLAQRGKNIEVDRADMLINYVSNVIEVL